MGQLGMGVMVQKDAASAAVFSRAVGKVISRLALEDDALRFTFEDGSKIKLYDAGQSCCESRYMTADMEVLSDFEGAALLDAEVCEAPTLADEYGDEHEVAFLHVKTSKGTFTMSSHNEHNGYYGGISIVCEKD